MAVQASPTKVTRPVDTLYFDHAATTAMHPDVLEAMLPHMRERYGNTSSGHRMGRAARAAVEDARDAAAQALGVAPNEVYFVRGGTEADNIVVRGCAQKGGPAAPIVLSAFEHPAVRRPAEVAPNPVHLLPVTRDRGLSVNLLETTLDDLTEAGAPRPCLVSVMWVNNETGDVQPILEFAERCRARGVPFHSDAVQALGRVPIDLARVPVDFLSISAHKVGGPQSTGLLVARSGTDLPPLLHGGSQERGLRPGTQDVAGAVGAATAVVAAVAHTEEESTRLTTLRDHLESMLTAAIPEARVHGVEGGPKAPHVLNVGVPGPDRTVLLAALDARGLAVSGGAACSSGRAGPSPVIEALYGPDHPLTAVRFSLGASTDRAQVEAAAQILIDLVGPGGALTTNGPATVAASVVRES